MNTNIFVVLYYIRMYPFFHTLIWIIYMSADYAHQNFILLWHLTLWLLLEQVLAFSCGFRSISLEKSCHTLEVKRSRSQPDLIFCSNILSSGHHSSQLAISYKIQYHIQQQHSQNHQVINHKRIFALFPPSSLYILS